MRVVHEGQLSASFRGFESQGTVFEFSDGSKWRQKQYKSLYCYKQKPYARIIEGGGICRIEVDGMNDSVEVVPVRNP